MRLGHNRHIVATLVVSTLLALGTNAVRAAIPAGERTALLNLYTSTNGATWTTSTSWNGAVGTECTWYGVTCDAGQATVISIILDANNLTGTLPSDLANLTNLTRFSAYSNELTGSIPPLTGLTNLGSFDVGSNELTGSIPPLAGLTSLYSFWVDGNQLTGSIPALTGLTNLSNFIASSNQLTGSIPALTGLTSLSFFWVDGNQLKGNVPSVPSPSALAPGGSDLCPNFLNHTPDPAWDTATGVTPWYTDCAAPPPSLDIDGNGTADALTDGLLVIRYLLGLRGAALIEGAIGDGAQRTSAPEIEIHIQSLLP